MNNDNEQPKRLSVKTRKKTPTKREIQHALLTLNRIFSERLQIPLSNALTPGANPEVSPLVSTRLAASYLGVSQKTMANWRCSGTMNLRYVQVGSRILYRQSDIEDFILTNTKSSTSQKSWVAHA